MRRRETNPASNQFLRCSPPSGTHRESQSWIEKRWGRKETEATWWRKKESPKEERVVKPVITSLRVLHSLDHSEMFMELYREEKREERDRGGQEDKGGNQKERDRSSQ